MTTQQQIQGEIAAVVARRKRVILLYVLIFKICKF